MAASDYQLLDRYATGDESAFEELVLRHQKTVYDLAYRMLENHADAADLAQKSFVQAFLIIGPSSVSPAFGPGFSRSASTNVATRCAIGPGWRMRTWKSWHWRPRRIPLRRSPS